MKSQTELAGSVLQALKVNKTYEDGNIRIDFVSEEDLHITGWTNYLNLENMNKSIAVRELEAIEAEFLSICRVSKPLQEMYVKARVTYRLAYDYEKAAIKICEKTDDKITWFSDL